MEKRLALRLAGGFKHQRTLAGAPGSDNRYMLPGFYVLQQAVFKFGPAAKELVADRASVFEWTHGVIPIIGIVQFCIVQFCTTTE